MELAGLQALMQQQKLREAEVQATATGEGSITRIDWTTHRKEGMRLKRLMEESSEGKRYPHMQELFAGSKEATHFKFIVFFFVFLGGGLHKYIQTYMLT